MLSLRTNKRCANAPSFVLMAFLLSAPVCSEAATVELKQISDPAGIVNQTTYPETATVVTSINAPLTSSDYNFTHWTLDGLRQEDYLGRSLSPFSFTIYENTTVVAHYLLTNQDSDDDGIEDWYEIEFYGALLHSSTSDTDTDGIDLSTEKFRGYHPNLVDTLTEGGISRRRSSLVDYNRGYDQLIEESVPLGIVSRSAYFETNSAVSLSAPPMESSGYYFTGWFIGDERIDNSFSVHPISITMTGDVTVVARYIEGTLDSDADGLPDWYEQFHFNGLEESSASDIDADLIDTDMEKYRGYNPNLKDTLFEGGISRRRSSLTDVNLAGFSNYELGSDPAGLVQTLGTVSDGTVVSAPDLWNDSQSGHTFAYWDLEGVRQQDAFGIALGGFSFSVTSDVVATAHYLPSDEDSDLDGIFDWTELNYYSDLSNIDTSDTDIDGFDFSEEVKRGYHPLLVDTCVEGGVSRRRSRMTVVNLQPFERVKYVQKDSVLTNFFTTVPSVPDGFILGTNTAPAAGDWDGDGDLDLFIGYSTGQMRIYENIGAPQRIDISERTANFPSISSAWSTAGKPLPALGDVDGDGAADLVCGGDGTLHILGSSKSFSEPHVSAFDYSIDTGDTFSIPSVGDIDGDGLSDLLVILSDGSTRLYSHSGNNLMPYYSGSYSTNVLGESVPNATGLSIADIGGDGLNDILVSDADGRIWEFYGRTNGTFVLKSKVWAGSENGFAEHLTVSAADLDGDGDTDALCGNARGGVIYLRDPRIGVPQGVRALGGAESVQMNWDPNQSHRLKGYYVYRAAGEGGDFGRLTDQRWPLNNYLDSTASAGILWHYYVTAVSEVYYPGNTVAKEVESRPSQTVIADIGSIVLWMPAYFGQAGENVVLQINVEHGTDISGAGMDIRVTYDRALLTPLSQVSTNPTVQKTVLTESLVIADNSDVATGELHISGSSGTVVGDGHLFDVYFRVDPGASAGTIVTNTFSSAVLQGENGVSLSVDSSDTAAFTVTDSGYFLGDVNGDGVLDMDDHHHLMWLLKKKTRDPFPEEISAGDLNGNGVLDHRDISLHLRLIHENGV